MIKAKFHLQMSHNSKGVTEFPGSHICQKRHQEKANFRLSHDREKILRDVVTREVQRSCKN